MDKVRTRDGWRSQSHRLRAMVSVWRQRLASASGVSVWRQRLASASGVSQHGADHSVATCGVGEQLRCALL